jgi:hypothetical protein
MDRPTRTQLDIWTEALWQERLTRRDFVRRGITLGVASSLLAEIVGLYTRQVAAETGPAPQVLERIKKEGKKLFVYNWEDYVHPNTIPRFEKEFGVKVTYDTFPSNEQLLAKLQAGGAKYDVIFPTHYSCPFILPRAFSHRLTTRTCRICTTSSPSSAIRPLIQAIPTRCPMAGA